MQTLEIVAPKNFRHAGNLRAKQLGNDPRLDSFSWERVIIDLRGASFVHPGGVLWCAIYSLLVLRRGGQCTLYVPENQVAASYLKTAGLFDLLKSRGAEIQGRVLEESDPSKVVLPLTRFSGVTEAESIADNVMDNLRLSNSSSSNIYVLVEETFGELANNAAEHSMSKVGAVSMVQFYEGRRGRKFVCAIADGGIGVRQSLYQNPAHRNRIPYDWAALSDATRERVSGTGDEFRGIGLFGVAEDMRHPHRELFLHSGIGLLHMNESLEHRATRTRLFPGCCAIAMIPC